MIKKCEPKKHKFLGWVYHLEDTHDWKYFTPKNEWSVVRARVCKKCGSVQNEIGFCQYQDTWRDVTQEEFDERLQKIAEADKKFDQYRIEDRTRSSKIEEDRLKRVRG